jgi:uncharacterized protein
MSKADILKIDALKHLLQAEPNLELAILVGSRSTDTATQHSDWDIAIRWKKEINGLMCLEFSAALKQKIADAIATHQEQIDLIDMTTARLAMRAVIAEEGLMLKGDDTLAWRHFLTQTWGELEDYYWRKQHAA